LDLLNYLKFGAYLIGELSAMSCIQISTHPYVLQGDEK